MRKMRKKCKNLYKKLAYTHICVIIELRHRCVKLCKYE